MLSAVPTDIAWMQHRRQYTLNTNRNMLDVYFALIFDNDFVATPMNNTADMLIFSVARLLCSFRIQTLSYLGPEILSVKASGNHLNKGYSYVPRGTIVAVKDVAPTPSKSGCVAFLPSRFLVILDTTMLSELPQIGTGILCAELLTGAIVRQLLCLNGSFRRQRQVSILHLACSLKSRRRS